MGNTRDGKITHAEGNLIFPPPKKKKLNKISEITNITMQIACM